MKDRGRALSLAKDILTRMRNERQRSLGAERFMADIKFIAKQNNLTLEEIGTSFEELESLIRDSHKNRAMSGLAGLRVGTDYPEASVEEINRELSLAGGLNLADVGTSEEELAELTKKCARFSIEWWLGDLRRGSYFIKDENDVLGPHVSWTINQIREYLNRYQWKPEDFGTTEQELQSFLS